MTAPTVCVGCKWAVWTRTKSGALHRNGDGRCEHPTLVAPVYPACVSQFERRHPTWVWISRRAKRFTECPTREAE